MFPFYRTLKEIFFFFKDLFCKKGGKQSESIVSTCPLCLKKVIPHFLISQEQAAHQVVFLTFPASSPGSIFCKAAE